MIKLLDQYVYWATYLSIAGRSPWYTRILGIRPRAFIYDGTIYVDNGAFYFNRRDFDLLIQHEKGHEKGLNHTLLGIMSAYGLVRYITSRI